MNRNPRIFLAAFALVLSCIQASAAGRGGWGFGLRSSCPGDLNNDGFVDDSDFVQFSGAYDILDCADPAMAPGCPADFNGDGFVDDSDFVVFAEAYNELLCAASEIVLRDSIGPDATLTNGGRVIAITTTATGGVAHVAFNLSPSETVTLKEVSMVVGSATTLPAIVWDSFDYQVRVWTSPQARSASPQLGDLLNCQFPFPSNFPSNGFTPPVFGYVVGIAPFNNAVASHLLTFDVLQDPNVSCPPVTLQSGGTYPIAIQAIRPPAAGSTIGIITSLETAEVDIRYTSTVSGGVPITSFSTSDLPLTGRVAYRVVGLRQ